jgi:hypothetical protein
MATRLRGAPYCEPLETETMNRPLQTLLRTSSLPIAFAGAIVVLALLALPAVAAPVGGPERASSKAEVLGHWTTQRMRRVRPLEHEAPSPGARPARSASPAASLRAPLLVPPGEPRPKAGAASFAVPGGSEFPLRTHGKVFGRMKGLGPYECSATVVSSPAATTVVTAAHCVKEPRGPWAGKLIFVPAFDRGAAPYGRWVGNEVWVDRRWARRGNSNLDFAAIEIAPRGGTPIAEAIGSRGIAFNGRARQSYELFGYPINKARGERLWGCAARLKRRDPLYRPPGPRPIGVRCDMGPGSSGGGWITADGLLASVTSFAYARRPRVVYGPYLSAAAERVWRRAGRP